MIPEHTDQISVTQMAEVSLPSTWEFCLYSHSYPEQKFASPEHACTGLQTAAEIQHGPGKRTPAD